MDVKVKQSHILVLTQFLDTEFRLFRAAHLQLLYQPVIIDGFGIVISGDGGPATAVTTGTLVEAVLDSGELGIDGGTAGWDLLCSAEIMAHRSGLCGSIRVCR